MAIVLNLTGLVFKKDSDSDKIGIRICILMSIVTNLINAVKERPRSHGSL